MAPINQLHLSVAAFPSQHNRMNIVLAAVPAQIHRLGIEENWSVTCAALVDLYGSCLGGGTKGKGLKEVALPRSGDILTFS